MIDLNKEAFAALELAAWIKAFEKERTITLSGHPLSVLADAVLDAETKRERWKARADLKPERDGKAISPLEIAKWLLTFDYGQTIELSGLHLMSLANAVVELTKKIEEGGKE